MKIHINLLRSADVFQETLRQDGWVVSAVERTDELEATHPQVGNEDTARSRLHRLGLLTSGSIRIEFLPQKRRWD